MPAKYVSGFGLIGLAFFLWLALTDQLIAQPKLEYNVALKEVLQETNVWLRATLKNAGDERVRVYWGDRAHPDTPTIAAECEARR